MVMTDKNIPVLDANNKFLSYTSPAKSRILLKDGRASIFSKDPFMLRLKGESGDNMVIRKQQSQGGIITNFTKYFSEPKEVYVQNMSATQISMTFPGFGGSASDVKYLLPRTKKPYNITQDVPFDLISRSTDFRKLVNRRNPPLLRLIEEDEFIEYYEIIAERNGTSFDEEMQIAIDIKNNKGQKPNHVSEPLQRELEQKLEDKREALEKPVEINPQIIGLCVRADRNQGPLRIDAAEFIEELESLLPALSIDDLEFVMTKGVYKKVKKFASDAFDELTTDEDE
jgi:hypothetical protein